MAAKSKKGTQKGHRGPPKQFYVPPDIKNLGQSANPIINLMRGEHNKRKRLNS